MGQDLWTPLAHIVHNGPVQYDKEDFFREYSLPAMAENADIREVTGGNPG